MPTEGHSIADQIERQLRKIEEELAGLTDEALNGELEIQPTNTLFQLGTHVAGSARFWAITCAGGTDFHRHRAGEFAASGKGSDLRADLDVLIGQIHESLDPLTGADLDRSAESDRRLSASGEPGDSRPLRDAVLHALEHTALHLGHIQITRQLLGFDPATTT